MKKKKKKKTACGLGVFFSFENLPEQIVISCKKGKIKLDNSHLGKENKN